MKLRSNRVFKREKPKIVSKIKNGGVINERRLSLRSSKLSYGKRGASEAGSYENLEMGVKKTLSTDGKELVLGLQVLDPVKDSVVSCSKYESEEEEEGHETTSICLNETGLDCENGSKSLESETCADDTAIVNGDGDKETSLNDPVKDLVFSCPTDEMEEKEGHATASVHLNETGLDCENGSKSLEFEKFADDTTVNGNNDKETSLNDSVKDLAFSCPTDEMEEEGRETTSIHLNETGLNCENGYKSLESETFVDDTTIVNGDDDKETSLNDPVEDMVVSGTVDEVEEEEGNKLMSIHLNETGIDCENGSKSLKSETFADDTTFVNGDDDKETSLNDPVKSLVFSCPPDEIEEEEGHETTSVHLNETGLDCESGSKSLESETFADDTTIVNGDDEKETSLNDPGNADLLGKCEEVKEKGRQVRKKKNVKKIKKVSSNEERVKVVLGLKAANDECKLTPLKHKIGNKRKNVEASGFDCYRRAKKEKVEKDCVGVMECDRRAKKEEIEKDGAEKESGKALQSRNVTAATASGGSVAAVNGFRAVVLGLKGLNEIPKKMLKRRGRPCKVLTEGEMVLGSKQLDEIPKKMLKRRGRPRKVLTEGENMRPKKKLKRRRRPCKLQGEIMPLALNEIPEKKLERRGRPRKVSHEIPEGAMKSCGIKHKLYGKGITFKKFKRPRTPPKMEAKTLATHVMKMRTVKPLSIEKSTNISKNEKFEENGENLMVEGEFPNAGKGIIGGKLARKQLKQLIRDKISNLLLKCGWTIKFKPRAEKSYNDAVYTEPNRMRSHWSITRAYTKLKWKIENGDADDIEMSAFTPIPDEEFSILFKRRHKELKEKKNKNLKNMKKGKIVTHRKKKHGKNSKVESKRKMIFKPRLLVRGSENGPEQDKEGALVIKKRNLLSWMIDSGVILAGTKVQYGKTRRQKMSSEGIITTDGISCGCCNEVMGITKFVCHCGGKVDQFFDNLYLECGTCLRKCLMDSWRKEEESNINRFNVVDVQGDDPNDDTCNICGDGGDLICCDGCPSTFHQSCLDVQNFPSGDWNCIYCTCKFCGVVSVSTPHVEDSHDSITSQMLSCCLCEEKFHQLCLQEGEDVNKDSNTQPFCGRKCQELFERLQAHLGVKHELEDGFSWTLLQRSDVDQESNFLDNRLKVEQNSKLAIAFHVMDECFLPIVDGRSGTSIIRSVVYNCGSNVRRLNYSGFLTAVLEKDDEFITAASIRIHGYQLAEMPFIGTRHTYRRQGMCRRLLDAIESTLSSLGVEELIIPAIPALLQTWINVFGFMPLEESKKQAMKCMSIMVFPGIDMLKKPLLQNHSADVDHTPKAAGVEKDVIGQEQNEETIICSSPKINDEINPQFETTSSNATDNKQTEKETVQMDRCSCPDLENGQLTISPGVNNLYDLNLPVKNVLPCDKDCQTSVYSEPFPCDKDCQTSIYSEPFPDCTTEPSSLESMVCENPESSEYKLYVDNDGVPGVKVQPSPTTSKLVLKNTFDLNLHPTAIETDVHIISDDSVQCESRACIVSFEISDSRSQVDQSAGGQIDSKTCESQPLVMH